MPEYTPTTDDVKRGYTAPRRAMVERLPEGETLGAWIMRQNAVTQHALNDFSDEAFDRWLADRDRENRAIGWDEGYGDDNDVHTPRTNPYRGDNR